MPLRLQDIETYGYNIYIETYIYKWALSNYSTQKGDQIRILDIDAHGISEPFFKCISAE